MIPINWYMFWNSMVNDKNRGHDGVLNFRICNVTDDFVRYGLGYLDHINEQVSEKQLGIMEFCAIADFILAPDLLDHEIT